MSSATPEPWDAFTQDPRRPEVAALRASDRDRDVVHGVLAEGYADGRLDQQEYDERSAAAAGAKTLGQLAPIISDLVPLEAVRGSSDIAHATAAELDAQAVRHWQRARRAAVDQFVFISVICWTVWALGGLHHFAWPVFPMLFVGLRIPQVLTHKDEIVAKERERLARRQRRALGGGFGL